MAASSMLRPTTEPVTRRSWTVREHCGWIRGSRALPPSVCTQGSSGGLPDTSPEIGVVGTAMSRDYGPNRAIKQIGSKIVDPVGASALDSHRAPSLAIVRVEASRGNARGRDLSRIRADCRGAGCVGGGVSSRPDARWAHRLARADAGELTLPWRFGPDRHEKGPAGRRQ